MSYKIVGYFENWAQYRPEGKGKFLPEQIDPSLLTHINFAFGIIGFVTWSVDPTESRTGKDRYTGDYTIQPVEWNDQKVLYPAIEKLKQKNPNLKTLLSLGGWSFNTCDDTPESAGTPHPFGPHTCRLFSDMASTAARRKQFIDSAINYAHKYGFDGIDIDWEYPGDRKRGGRDNDFDNFLALLKEFRAAINRDGKGLLLTIAAAAVKKGEAKSESEFFAWMKQCVEPLDWMNVMTYDYHGAFDPVTGVNAPLLEDSEPGGTFCIKDTVDAYLDVGIPADKIVLGLPTYGRTFIVNAPLSSTNHSYGKPTGSAGPAGYATQTPGFLAYYEILDKLNSGELTRVWDEKTLTPYAYNSDTREWLTYDDEESLAYKVSYLIEQGLGGAMVWAIDDDSFFSSSAPQQVVSRNSSLRFPLLNNIKVILDNPERRPGLRSDNRFGDSHEYGKGRSPNVALNNKNIAVQVYGKIINDFNPDCTLMCRVGKVKGNNTIEWFEERPYDKGVLSSIAINDDGVVVEAHASELDDSLWCRVGKVNGNTIEWFASSPYDNGRSPSIAINNHGLVVEVHPSEKDDELWCRVGYVRNNTIEWSQGKQYEQGWIPSVAINNNGLVVTTHNLEGAAGAFAWGVGKVTASPSQGEILWSNFYETGDPGYKPSIAINDNGIVVEAHRKYDRSQQLPSPQLFYRTGTVDGKMIHWNASRQYGEGREPKVACNTMLAVEVHDSYDSDSDLSYSTLPLTQPGWTVARGSNSYVYCQLDELATQGQEVTTTLTVELDAGAPYLYAALVKNQELIDFPTGVVLEITASDGTIYNQESHRETPLVILSRNSLRGLLVEDPLPGTWNIKLSIPKDVEFYFQLTTLPAQDVVDVITTTPYIKNGAKSGQQRLVNHQVTQAFVASSEKTPEELFTWVLPLATLYVLCFNDQAIPPEDRRESLQEVDESLETATEGEWSTPTSPTASLPTATQAIATAMVQAQETQLVLVGDVERHSNITLFEIVDARGTRHRFDAANAGDDIFMQGIRIMRRLYRDRVTNRAGVQDFAFRIETAEEDFRSPWVRIQVALASGALYLIAVNSNTDATPAFTTRWESESTELNDGWRRIGESSYAKLRASETNISLDSINSALNTVMDWARGGGRINSRPGRAIATLALISESIRNDVAAFMLDTMLGGVTARVGRPGRPESAREFDGNSYERLWTHLELLFLDWNDMSLEYYNQPRLAPITLTHSQSFARGRAADTRLAPEKRKLWRSILKIIESLQLLQYTDSPPPNNN